MAEYRLFKRLTGEYHLEWVWDYDITDNRSRGPGYRIYHYDLLNVLGCVTKYTLDAMTDTELEEFVVGCAVLSMQPVPDVWRV